MQKSIFQYLVITSTYWAFTVTDGALRMLVVLYFHKLGYSALELASLFLFYEFFGVVTNFAGGWLGARIGLNRTMHLGVLLQVLALALLTVSSSWLSVSYVMMAQALSGIAKDLNKMSAKSSIKMLATGEDGESKLFKWVAYLTGSKNALKGVGFFAGAGLLSWFGFRGAVIWMIGLLVFVFAVSAILLTEELGKTPFKPKFRDLFSKSRSVNILSAARMFLFGSRDIWFVVALPVFFERTLNWSHIQVGSFMALWVIVYGVVQSQTPRMISRSGHPPDGRSALLWAVVLAGIPAAIAFGLGADSTQLQPILVGGLLFFGAVFAINSSVHSYLIIAYAKQDGVSLDVGFYYMANAMGRLVGTILSGWIFQMYDLMGCLIGSSLFLVLTVAISVFLPGHKNRGSKAASGLGFSTPGK